MLMGERIVLRPLEVDDLSTVARWRNDPRIRTAFLNKMVVPISGQKRWYDHVLADRSKQYFVSEMRDGNKPVGLISLVDIDFMNRKAELGTTIVGDQSMWGKGLASEMIGLLLHYAFLDLSLNKIYAYAIETNIGSIRAKEKSGFKIEGLLREHHMYEGRCIDVFIFGLTRDDWRKQLDQRP